ncbi:MAG: hypothetical protein H0W50_02440 [Parachlamydiaceae bacterium]|nr:hypothetical protein [Parachlamydiaceae bacterium]
MHDSTTITSYNLNSSNGAPYEPLYRSELSQLETQLKVVEDEVISGIFKSLIETLNIFTLHIEHPSLREKPEIGFRYLELANKIPKKDSSLQKLLQNVHKIFMRYKVYENANPKKNVLISCSKGSVLSNKIILKLSYPYFEEKIKSCTKLRNDDKVKCEIKFDEINSLEALEQFCVLTYNPEKFEHIKDIVGKETLFELFYLSKKISHASLGVKIIKTLVMGSRLKNSEDLGILLDLDEDDKLRWIGFSGFLKRNKISFMESNNQEIALNVKQVELLAKNNALSTLMQAYTTGLYVECVDDIAKLLNCHVRMKVDIRKKITTLIFPGFQYSGEREYETLANLFPNISNIIVRSKKGPNEKPPGCFPSLELCSWIRDKERDFTPSGFMAEVNYREVWLRSESRINFERDISPYRFNKSFSWKIEKDGCISDLFCQVLQYTPLMAMY